MEVRENQHKAAQAIQMDQWRHQSSGIAGRRNARKWTILRAKDLNENGQRKRLRARHLQRKFTTNQYLSIIMIGWLGSHDKCWWDSNRGSLVSEVPALSTMPLLQSLFKEYILESLKGEMRKKERKRERKRGTKQDNDMSNSERSL